MNLLLQPRPLYLPQPVWCARLWPSSSRRLKGVYRITTSGDEDKNYSIDFQPAGRRKMKGTITGTTTVVSVMIEPRERPAGLRLEDRQSVKSKSHVQFPV